MSPREFEKKSWTGLYRARVTEVDIEDGIYGAVRVYIPDLMDTGTVTEGDSSFDEMKSGLIAYPANNMVGGYNKEVSDCHYQSTLFVPAKGSWVWVFFEGGDPSKPFYLTAYNYRAFKVPPESTEADKPHKVAVLYKSHEGRSIIISDSPDCARVEITGKRRQIKGMDPEGNTASVYTIDGNMTTILLDERQGKEKLLIRTYKGDYLQLDIEARKFEMYCKSDITILTDGKFNLQSKGGIQIQTDGSFDLKVQGDIKITTDSTLNTKSSSTTYIDSDDIVHIQLPGAQPATPIIIPDGGLRD